MEEWPTEEKEVMKILTEVAVARREAEIVSFSEMDSTVLISYGPHCEKTCLRGFRKSEFQTSLLNYRD